MFKPSTLAVLWMFEHSILGVLWIFEPTTLGVLWLFEPSTLVVLWMFGQLHDFILSMCTYWNSEMYNCKNLTFELLGSDIKAGQKAFGSFKPQCYTHQLECSAGKYPSLGSGWKVSKAQTLSSGKYSCELWSLNAEPGVELALLPGPILERTVFVLR